MKPFVLFEFAVCFVRVGVISCVLEALELEPLVILKDLSGGHNIVGKNIELECRTTFYAKYVSVEWETPQHIQKNVTLEENTNSTYATISTLVIHESQKEHSGFFTCKIIHNEWNHTVASRKIWVTVYDAENVIEISDENEKHFFKKANAEIEVPIIAHPNISVIWYDPKRETINNSTNITISLISVVNDEKYNYKAKLRFNNITKNDLGKYTLVVKNDIPMKTKKIFVNVSIEQQIALSLNIVEINEEEMIATYQCKAAGDPKPYIVWKFISRVSLSCLDKTSQLNNKIGELTLKESDHEDRGLQITSYVVVNLTHFGILKCVTQNEEATEPINYVQNRFETYLTDKNDYTIKRKSMKFGYAQFVLISCSRSQNKYTPYIVWYHNGKQINEKNCYYVNGSDILLLDTFISTLHFEFVVENQIGNYSCRVLTKTGKIESKTVEVVSKHMPGIYPLISLKDLNGGHTKVGQDIRLMCNVTFHKHVKINWYFLQSNEKNRELFRTKIMNHLSTVIDKTRFFIRNSYFNDSNTFITTSNLTVTQAKITESGYYKCRVTKKEIKDFYGYYLWVQVNDINYTSLIFNEEPKFNMHDMNIKVFITAHPQLVVKWYDNHKQEITVLSNTSNYFVHFQWVLNITKTDSNYEATLEFKSIDVKNFGNYTIVAENGYNKPIKHLVEVNVTGIPVTKILIHEEFASNVTLKCTSTANPKPTIEWYFKTCTTLKCMEIINVTKFQNEYIYKTPLRNESNGLSHISYISVSSFQRGILICRGVNSFGENYTHQPILGSQNDFEMFTESNEKNWNETVEFVGKNELKVACMVSKWNYTGEFAWSHNSSQFQTFGLYNSKKKEKIAKKFFLLSTFSELTIPVDSPSDIYYTCSTLNKTDMTLKSRTLHVKSRLSSYVTISNSSMTNKSLQMEVSSKLTFYCYAEGFPSPTVKWYKDEKQIVFSERFKFLNNRQVFEIDFIVPGDEGEYSCKASNSYNSTVRYCRLNVVIQIRWEYIQVILVVCAILLVVVLQLMKIKQAKKEKKLNLYGLVSFQKGALEKINPALGIEDQAALLPFDRKWEIPLKKIAMGKQLGSGAFGVTYQATVIDHFPDDSSKTVAVKTINPMSGYECVKALASEMKIMSHLGSHVNIVNFLGATTKYIVKNELYITLEFCSFGNLLKYIQRYSLNFIDQRNESDDFIWSSDDSDLENFEKRKSVSSKDLVVWSFQVARGMEYLGHRRVVHGDLAARNILLTEKNVIKLCDFGLAKNVYNYGNYVKKSEGPLPVKWMAIEAVEKGIFSTQSDIWSFGVVLWEMFSLGKVPFSGVTVDEYFCKKLSDGFRMEKPETASTKIYNLMLSCWQIDPSLRPSFSDLVGEIGSLLGEPTKDYYVIMNKDYLLMNKERFENSPDYLTMIPPPTYENVVSNLSGEN